MKTDTLCAISRLPLSEQELEARMPICSSVRRTFDALSLYLREVSYAFDDDVDKEHTVSILELGMKQQGHSIAGDAAERFRAALCELVDLCGGPEAVRASSGRLGAVAAPMRESMVYEGGQG